MWLVLNQYSFVAIGLLALATVTFLSWRLIGIKCAVPVSVLTLTLLVAFQIFLSTGTNPYSSVEDFENSLSSGQPLLLMLYSDL